MRDEMKRGRSQIIWRYTPGATFRHNESGGWCYVEEVTLRDPKPLTGALAEAVAQALTRWDAIGTTSFPDPKQYPQKYSVGEPYQVWFNAWPLVFTCRTCGRLHYYQDLTKLRQKNSNLSCITCKGRDRLRQVPYAYVCECGRLDAISVQKHEYNHPVELVNKGSFQESYWRCRVCRRPLYRNPREALGYRPCTCAPKRLMRGVLLEDSRVYYSQTVDLVEVEPAVLEQWQGNSRFSDLLLSAVLRTPTYCPEHIRDLAKWKPSTNDLSLELKATRDLLIQNGMDEAQADAIVRQGAKQAGADPWVAYDSSLTSFRSMVGPHLWNEKRRTIEYIFVRDEPTAVAVSLDDLIRQADELGDQVSVERLTKERDLADQLGLINLQVVQALPILLAGIGYSRYFSSPKDASETDDGQKSRPVLLRPYQSQDKKIPIYVARNTTEALLYELDPWRLAAFLELNTNLRVPSLATVSTPAIRAWLLGQCSQLIDRGESHFVLRWYEEKAGLGVDEPSALMFGVLHTMSHVLKATAHRYVGIDSDALAEYLFPAHGAGLLYVSSHVEFTLGGIDSVFRANLTQWLGSARDYAGRCSFDPVCGQSGGACLACLYPKFGCAYFNRTVSRSFLFGGDIPGRTTPLIGFWDLAVTEGLQRLKEPSTTLF